MACERVKEYLEKVGYGARFCVRETTADTVEHAAETIGCLPAQIPKTMSFLLGDTVIVIVASGDTKIANAKYKATFGAKAAMIPFDRVEELTGHAPGGSHNTTVGLSPEELECITYPISWVDVCALRE